MLHFVCVCACVSNRAISHTLLCMRLIAEQGYLYTHCFVWSQTHLSDPTQHILFEDHMRTTTKLHIWNGIKYGNCLQYELVEEISFRGRNNGFYSDLVKISNIISHKARDKQIYFDIIERAISCWHFSHQNSGLLSQTGSAQVGPYWWPLCVNEQPDS